MGAEAGIVKAQQIAFNQALKTASANTLTAAQSIQLLDNQVGFQDATTDAGIPQQVAGPDGNLLNGTETGDASVFENPNGGSEPTLSFKTEGSVTQEGTNEINNTAVHGNSLNGQRPTWGYELYNNDGTFLKNDITSEPIPENRYTQYFMSDKYMEKLPFSNRRDAWEWVYLQNLLNRGPLNKNMH